MSDWVCQIEYGILSMSDWVCKIEYGRLSMADWVCQLEYGRLSMADWVWQIEDGRLSVADRVCQIEYGQFHIRMLFYWGGGNIFLIWRYYIGDGNGFLRIEWRPVCVHASMNAMGDTGKSIKQPSWSNLINLHYESVSLNRKLNLISVMDSFFS